MSARRPIRTTASSTMASTAAFSPKNSVSSHAGLLERRVERREDEDDDEAGQHEQRAGDEAAARAVEQPADIGGELLRLRAGQQHAEIEGVQEARLGDPLPLLDQHPVHERDLPGRARRS